MYVHISLSLSIYIHTCATFRADSFSPQISGILVGSFTLEMSVSAKLRKAPQSSAKLRKMFTKVAQTNVEIPARNKYPTTIMRTIQTCSVFLFIMFIVIVAFV